MLTVLYSAALGVGVLSAVLRSRHWPLVGDASLMHYVIFLLQRGQAPYSQVVDINLPGSYLLEAMSMKLFGDGAGGLRLYDGFLCLVCCICMAVLGKLDWSSRLLGLGSGLLLTLVHLQDGVGQAGQRDLAMTAILLSAYVVLLRVTVFPAALSILIWQLLIGFTVTIKPTLLPLTLAPVLIARRGRYFSRPEDRIRHLLFSLAGLCLPLIAALVWLVHFGALEAFVRVFRSIGILHGAMGRRSLTYLLSHCASPLIILFPPWIALTAMARSYRDTENKVFLAGLLCGLASYVAQGKGYPYQRYPFLAFFLLLLSRELAGAIEGSRARKYVAYATTLVACLWLGPRSTWLVHSYSDSAPFQETLATDLQKRHERVKGGVQCLDTFGGCINVLYNLRIVQSTGYLYDCYLFSPPGQTREEYRDAFLRDFSRARPTIVVVTDQFCFDGRKGFEKIQTWSEFDHQLAGLYTLDREWIPQTDQRWWTRSEKPTAYRLYVRK